MRPTDTRISLGDAYAIERELGGGGMARVFLATEVALKRRVVVKLLPAELAQGLSAGRFAREIALAAALQDPHIVPVLTAGTTSDGLPFYAMPYVEGDSLRARLLARPASAGPLPLAESIAILRDVARALEYAHAHGVVHRDIKPENILLAGRGAVVADFGIARAMTEARTWLPARGGIQASEGTATGTPAYMAPEQALAKPVHAAADLYAWGVLAWELLAGRHPFAHCASGQELMLAHANEPAPSLLAAAPATPPALAALVMQCLAKRPDDRPASATVLLEALGAAVADGVVPSMLSATPGTTTRIRGVRLRRGWLAAAAGALCMLLAVTAWQRMTRARALPVTRALRAASSSVAVLPFEHQGDSANAYLTEGITDEIRSRLAGVRDLVVIARASSVQYRASTKSPREIAEELGVRWLLTGTVRVMDVGGVPRVLVRPELVEVPRDGAPRSAWGDPFDAQGTNLLRVQGEIAARVVDAMQVALSGADRARVQQVASRDPRAYDAYLRGQAAVQYGADVSGEAQQRAIPLFEEAVQRDSLLLDAWVALARARVLLYSNGRERSVSLAADARAAVDRVVALDREGARGHMVLGTWLRIVARDMAAATRELEIAVQRDPGDARTNGNLALLLDESLGRPAEAIPYFERARTLDPRSVIVWRSLATALAALGRMDEARDAADRARALAPANEGAAIARLEVELASGDTTGLRTLLTTMLRDLPIGRGALSLGALAGASLDSMSAQRLLAVAPDAVDGDRGQWALLRAQLLMRRGDERGARLWADSARRVFGAEATRPSASAAVLRDLAVAEALAVRPAAARTAMRAVVALRQENGEARGSDWAADLYPLACAAARAGARDSAVAWLAEVRAVPSLYTEARVRGDGCLRL